MEYPRQFTLIEKLLELDKVQLQVVRGLLTIREALNQRIRIMTECSVILQDMLRYELGEEFLDGCDKRGTGDTDRKDEPIEF